MERRVQDPTVARGRTGHVFSLGHGVVRETNPQNLQSIVKMVHEQTRSRR